MKMENQRMTTIILIFLFSLSAVSAESHKFDYVVIGAGPAGLQMGYFLQKAQRNYVILERGNASGSFFTIYPRHDKLISINKRHTGRTNPEFNLRHDWNSLLSVDDTLKFGRYTKQFFPHKSDFVKYLNDFEKRFQLNVWHNVDAHNISNYVDDAGDGYKYIMRDLSGNTYLCKTLVVATGLWQPNLPSFPGAEYTEGYETVSTNPDDFEGQTVLILGRGNSAFEVADSIYGATNVVHLVGRSRVRFSWSTHYVGDLRGVNNGILDTYQLKSLDGVSEVNIDNIIISKNGSKYSMDIWTKSIPSIDKSFDNFAFREDYDRVIRCLGLKFNFSLFDSSLDVQSGEGRKAKWPKIQPDFQVDGHPDLYLAGTITHSLDFRKAAGGFVHGFRYTSRALHRLLEWKNHGIPWSSTRNPLDDMLPMIIRRVNEASGIYQMIGQLSDVVAFHNDSFEYFEEFPTNLMHEFPKHTGRDVGGVLVITLQYGADFSGAGRDTFQYRRATLEPWNAHKCNFLHPVIYYYRTLPSAEAMASRGSKEVLPRPDRIHHIVEDFHTVFSAPINNILPFRRFLEGIIDRDMREFYAEECLQAALTYQTVPHTCQSQFSRGNGLAATEEGLEFLPHSTMIKI